MKNVLLLLAVIFSTSAISQSYQNAESVAWDAANNRWLVANGSNIIIDDGNGNLDFFGAASASHGMEIIGDVLFALDSNIVKGYMLDDASQVMSLTISGVGFLNGMGSDIVNNILYISDFGNNKIFSVDVSDINNPSFVEIVSNTGGMPNGVLYDGATNNRLLFVTWGNNAKIKQVDLTDFSVSDVVSNTGFGNLDGIVYSVIMDAYYVSSWSPPRMIIYPNDFSNGDPVNVGGLSNPADVGIDPVTDFVGIPMGDEVLFTMLNPLANVGEFNLSEIAFKLSENPLKSNSYIEFTIEDVANMNIDLYNIEGKKVAAVFSNESVVGFNKIALPVEDLASGTYLLHISVDNRKQIIKLLVK